MKSENMVISIAISHSSLDYMRATRRGKEGRRISGRSTTQTRDAAAQNVSFNPSSAAPTTASR
jgi:hypothetical protein